MLIHDKYRLYTARYANGNTAILMRDASDPDDPQFYQRVTTNLGGRLPADTCHLDINHLPFNLQLALSDDYTQIGETPSGFLNYPKIRFTQAFLDQLTPLDE